MSRVCELSGVKVLYGHHVSHSQIKTNRRFEPNLRTAEFKSSITGQSYRVKISMNCLRSIDKAGGFDQYMIRAHNSLLSQKAKRIKKQILQKHTNQDVS